ncbi:hypothetical protein NWFMUON74_05850 [Nocardia wallacei]|uniref:Uncharacterized protein n=1 Tax=Nocardia wallacei TaxID=480035 RepID=A0A7G1KEY2_9NOCA|nr:hypothetical protein NWFMUON74_05850 [Nocardia wallacei]
MPAQAAKKLTPKAIAACARKAGVLFCCAFGLLMGTACRSRAARERVELPGYGWVIPGPPVIVLTR